MMDDPVSYRRLVNNTVFRIENVKLMIRAVPIRSIQKLITELKKIIFEMTFKHLYIFSFHFSLHKPIPR